MLKVQKHSKKNPKVLAVLPGFIPSTQIDVISPLISLHISNEIDFRIQLENTVGKKDIDWADLLVLCRNTEPGQGWSEYVSSEGKPYIYDIDDNFFDIVGDSPEARYHRSPERIAMLTQYLHSASLVRVYSEPLHARALTINPKVVRVVSPQDFHNIRPRPASGDTIKIVYATSRAHDELFSIFLLALQKVLDKYKGKVNAYFLGFTPPSLKNHPFVRSVSMIWDYPAYLRNFSSAGYDIGLAPLLDDVFHRSKTNNKFREYGACQIAGIYSNVDVYSSCVIQHETGILVANQTEDWYDALVLLIENPELRQKIQSAAYEFVQKNYSQDEFVKNWLSQIKDVLEVRKLKHQVISVAQEDVAKKAKKRGLIEKLSDKFSQSNRWMPFFSLLTHIARQRISSLFLLWKYQIIITWFRVFKHLAK